MNAQQVLDEKIHRELIESGKLTMGNQPNRIDSMSTLYVPPSKDFTTMQLTKIFLFIFGGGLAIFLLYSIHKDLVTLINIFNQIK